MNPDTTIAQAGELLRLLAKSPQAPRELVSAHLRGKKKLDAATRAAISTLAFHALRALRFCHAAVTGEEQLARTFDAEHARRLLAASLLLADAEMLPQPLPYATEEHADFALAARRALPDHAGVLARALRLRADAGSDAVAAATMASVPDWIFERWQHAWGDTAAALALGRALLDAAPLTLRVNLQCMSRAALIDALGAQGVEARAHPLLPAAVTLERRARVMEGPLYEQGCFEVQDAGSQLIGYALGEVAGRDVLDACAGGGGKTMHLLDRGGGSMRLAASDSEAAKLRALRMRAARLPLSLPETRALPPSGDVLEAFGERRFDVILVDAPCSGLGTARRDPGLKWKLSTSTITRLAARQYDILRRNAALLRPGGMLLYATCSLLPEENQHVARRFLEEHDNFQPDALAPVFAAQGLAALPLASMTHEFTVHPALLDSDGFYFARFRRNEH